MHVCLSLWLHVCHPSIYIYFYVCLSVIITVCLSSYIHIYFYACLSIFLTVCLSSLHTFLSLFVCLYDCLSVSIFVCLCVGSCWAEEPSKDAGRLKHAWNVRILNLQFNLFIYSFLSDVLESNLHSFLVRETKHV